MISAKLTCGACPAHKTPMKGFRAQWTRAAMVMAGLPMLSGCVTVNAPTEPIVIELNINITQEVIYRLAEDAGNAIDENADIF
jgi:YnbE-like lipoprotein